jgi:hypothetical protein
MTKSDQKWRIMAKGPSKKKGLLVYQKPLITKYFLLKFLALILLSDAELAEDLIQNIFTRRHADDLAEMAKSLLELDGHEFR